MLSSFCASILSWRIPDTASQFNSSTNAAVFQEQFETCKQTAVANKQGEKMPELTRVYKQFQAVSKGTIIIDT